MSKINMIKRQLEDSLVKDVSKKSRVKFDGETLVVQMSGTTVGLIMALAEGCGMTYEQVLEELNA